MLGLSKKSGSSADKRPKLKLTKEQKLYVRDMAKLDSRIRVCCEYIEIWKQFFAQVCLIDDDSEIAPADEKTFFQALTALARKEFHFVESMGPIFDGDKDVMKILCSAVSLSAIKSMNENTRDKLHLDWHNQFLNMNKALGRLLRMMPNSNTLTQNLANLRNAPAAPDQKDAPKAKK